MTGSAQEGNESTGVALERTEYLILDCEKVWRSRAAFPEGASWTDVIRLQPPPPALRLRPWPLQWKALAMEGLQIRAIDSEHGIFQMDDMASASDVAALKRHFYEISDSRKDHFHAHLNAPPTQGRPASVNSRCGTRESTVAWAAQGPQVLRRRIQAVTGADTSRFEPMSINRYPPSGFQGDHFDSLEGRPGGENDRLITVLVYLSDTEEGGGGATFFPELNLRVQPRLGSALIFFPSLPDSGGRNSWLRHCSEDTHVSKWSAQQWIRQRPYGFTSQSAAGRATESDPVTTGRRPPRSMSDRVPRRIVQIGAWRCGGATLCGMAERNFEVLPNPGAQNQARRCALEDADGRPLWPGVVGSSSDSSSSLATFTLWPWPLPTDALQERSSGVMETNRSRDMAFVALIRNPLEQAVSHYRHVQALFDGVFSSFTEFVAYGHCLRALPPEIATAAAAKVAAAKADCAASAAPRSPKLRDHLGQFYVAFQDNQQLRWLLGGADAARAVLRAKDLEIAKAKLDRCDMVMLLEELHRRDRHRLAAFLWKDLDDRPPTAGSPAATVLAAAELAALRTTQQWDLELYAYAAEVAARQALATAPPLEHMREAPTPMVTPMVALWHTETTVPSFTFTVAAVALAGVVSVSLLMALTRKRTCKHRACCAGASPGTGSWLRACSKRGAASEELHGE
eukprot:gnl/TRDRNA2_/TRDRNA2_172667_c0_seq14.p1 gnl/TRDRNA2_/TRDRNA2_172667_c0~~gnl/TRDRNA2_/TRDRNA2_172667_c0_seq14.p1  ORF type:complete len:683 (-),score=91.85 gnl/TRDRNA2_/TRDRNA2_172667_c0_seq14:52-2100(-)